MSEPARRKCRGPRCTKDVLFVKDQNGKTQVLDAVAPVFRVEDGVAIRMVNVYVSHFATCIDANNFSKSAKEGT